VVEPSLYVLTALYVSIALAYAVVQERYAGRHAAASPAATGHRWPSLDVVLPCYNEDPQFLADCCRSLERQDYPGDVHVFIVDDGSRNRDAVLEVYRRYQGRAGWTVTLLDRNRGKRNAQDAAVRTGRGELVVTIDSDTVLAPDGLRQLVGPFTDEKVGAVTGDVRVRNLDHSRLTRLIDERYRLLFEQERAAQGSIGAVLCCSGPFSAYRRSALEVVWHDYLTQTFLGRPCVAGDDIHLTNLVLASGLRSLYEPTAKAWTTVPTTLRRYLRQQVRWNRSFYRELGPTLRVLPGRSPYLVLDVGARLLLPLLLAAGIVLTGLHTVSELGQPVRALIGAGLLAVVCCSSAGLLARKTDARPRRQFVVLYGLVYVFLLIPARLWALATLRQNRWGTRRVAGRAVPARRRMAKMAGAMAEVVSVPAEVVQPAGQQAI